MMKEWGFIRNSNDEFGHYAEVRAVVATFLCRKSDETALLEL